MRFGARLFAEWLHGRETGRREYLFAELRVLLQAFEGLLGGALVGLLLAIAYSIACVDTRKDDRGAEYGVLVGVGVGVNELKLDGDSVLLCPLDEAGLEVLLGLDQVVQVKELLDQTVDDEFAAAFVSLVQIDGPDEGLKGIAADVAVVGGGVCHGAHMGVEMQAVADAVQALTLNNLGSRRGEETLMLARVGVVEEVGDDIAQHGIAQKFQPLVVAPAPVVEL